MIRATVLYPNSDSATFDLDYYRNKHLPMVTELVGDALISTQVDAGLAGGAPGLAPTYIAMGHLTFASIEAFQEAFIPHQAAVAADLENYTNTRPTLQFSQIIL